jgi:hypothetical protein
MASFQRWRWCPNFRHADRRLARRSRSTFQAHLMRVQVCPDWPGAEQLAAFLRRVSIISLSKGGIVHVGHRGGSSAKLHSTSGGDWEKKHCESMLATLLCVCTIPSGPYKDGTLDSFHSCLHMVTSHSLDFSMYSSTHQCFTTRTIPLNRA